ncbi:phenylalanyl-tRNA synthetase beta subunit [Tistlia consotensis]|uniref:Phenylalanine--tRNA ligase beta subunit n=1 Tax=Tistlia consotensis USBA 355 TaxID=560819 RepID=A0A1Y6CGF4_9PROT|nr:phenylalanine--tRNA ligase subunit beta [Tistlia consotensis]SMF62826.1 phenylalanyl-tRNA synthetase beta subunit [Tistlia consotensis USBA 355]SNR95189.1 phenylalanyl-tRNA synthetase beta subunit [Tistlia consotensis]
MKFTLSWLRDHLETAASVEKICETLSLIGLEVESVEDRGRALAPFTVAYVEEAAPHPNADRLRVCQLRTKDGPVQVVCGAPNARTGMTGVFAPTGTHIPGTGIDLKSGMIRGVASNGMLVSEREMGLSDDHEGIIDLSPAEGAAAPQVGTPFARILGLDDVIIEVGITPNRGDCLGVRGIARDLAAAGLGRLKPFQAPKVEGSYASPIEWRITEGAEGYCPFVAGRHFRGLTNGPSPAWLQRRLTAIGLRPISALVDITNYVTFDLGRPLHVFDAAKVKGDPTMRFAREGEEILALDGRTYALDPETLVIADGNGPEGIGGVMGGELSGCTEETTEVFLEVALFDPISVAFAGRRLGIHSDARYRFERGLDPESGAWGPEVAARLILELCGGEASEVVTAGTIPDTKRSLVLRKDRCETLGGVPVPDGEQVRILQDLGFEVTDRGDDLEVAVPSWRPDVECEACLVEEVLRLHGYEHLPTSPLTLDTAMPLPALSTAQRRASAARTALCWSGLEECVTFSFVAERHARLFGWSDEALRLDNPISAELDVMRPSVLIPLIEAAARNADRGFGDSGLFEVGPAYETAAPDGQRQVAAALRVGHAAPRHWAAERRPVDAFDAKADALRVLEAAGAPVDNLQVSTDAPGWYHPGQSGCLRLGPKVLARFGTLHPRVLKAFDLKGPAVATEIFLETVPEPKRKGTAKPALALSPLMPVERDYAFVVDRDIPADKLIRAAKGADRALIAEVALFDDYRGAGLPEGKKSLALAVTLQPREKTLTEQDLEAVSKKIVAAVEKATGAVLRG